MINPADQLYDPQETQTMPSPVIFDPDSEGFRINLHAASLIVFGNKLQEYVDKNPKNANAKRLKRILSLPEPKRTKSLKRLEAYIRAHFDVPAEEAIDWSKIDWQEVLTFLFKILIMILPLLI